MTMHFALNSMQSSKALYYALFSITLSCPSAPVFIYSVHSYKSTPKSGVCSGFRKAICCGKKSVNMSTLLVISYQM